MNYKTGITNYFLNVLIALIVLSLGSFAYNQSLEVYDNIQIAELKKQDSEYFFKIFKITPIADSFPIGTYPSFNFDSIYHQTGSVEGSNVLVCDNYRSNPFEASGFITKKVVNQRPAFSNAFVVNSDLPNFQTSCILISEITFCTETYPEVCKTTSTDSSKFNFE